MHRTTALPTTNQIVTVRAAGLPVRGEPKPLPGCQIRNLAYLAYAQGFNLFVYRTDEPFDAALAPGYFNQACDVMGDGDHLHIKAADGGGMRVVHVRGSVVALEAAR